MGKKQQQKAEEMSKEQYNKANTQSDEMMGRLKANLPEQEKNYQNVFDTTKDAYTQFTGGYGAYNPSEYEANKAQNVKNIQSGGYNPEQLESTRQNVANQVRTGGYDADELAKLKSGYGGLDPTQVGKVRGGYDELIRTGGLSDNAADAMRRQAAGTTQSIYSTLGSKLARTQGISGTGGAGGETAQMARQAATAGATATTGANAEIGRLRQSGIVSGVGGLGQFETGVGAANRGALSDIAAGRRAGVSEQIGLESGVARGTLQASQANQDLASGAATQRIQAAGGLNNLYQSEPGYVTSIVKSIMQQQQIGGQLSGDQVRIMTELAQMPGLFDNIMKGISTVGGAAAGVMTGVGGLSGGGKGYATSGVRR